MSVQEFRLPDPGEGLTEADIVSWRVAVGDTVEVNDIVVEVETAKSLVELPVPFSGLVTALLVQEGDTVEVGTPIIAVETSAAGGPPAPAPAATRPGPDIANVPAPSIQVAFDRNPADSASAAAASATVETKRTAVLVGYGVKQTEAVRRPRRSGAEVTSLPLAAAMAEEAPPPDGGVVWGSGRALAKPPVRKLARDLGVDLTQVTGTGADGIVTRDDVTAYAQQGAAAKTSPARRQESGAAPVRRGEDRVPIKGVRKATAAAMVSSAFTAPHVTEWVTVDVTATVDLVDRLKKDREFDGVKVTALLVVCKAMCLAVRRNPGVNATWDERAQEIVEKRYVNLGVAAATPRGLLVPNIKDADTMAMRELAESVGALIETARQGRTQPADMTGGTITVTNVGVFGVDSGTPILNPGESAILAFGAVARRPWVVGTGREERIEPRWVTTLALSFDHRVVDGELGSRYLADVAAILGDPARALVWG